MSVATLLSDALVMMQVRHPVRQGRAVLIAGPTASGKSALAVALSRRCGGNVINADSMQVYADLAVLTARPRPEDTDHVPHRLFGTLDAAEHGSAAAWHDQAMAEVKAAWRLDRVPVIVGGTGLYFRSLLEGLAPVPEIPPDVRAQVRAETKAFGPKTMHSELSRRDPEMAARLSPADSQRVARALEVVRATGRSLRAFQRDTVPGGLAEADAAGRVVKAVLDLPRDNLYRRCDARFEAMLSGGAIDEVARLAARRLDPNLPAMKALGVPALIGYLNGEIDRETAVAEAKRQTRRYAKRQLTWLKTQFSHWPRLDATDPGTALAWLKRRLAKIEETA